MRMLKKLLATAVVTASATAMAVGPALADPINGSGKPVTPKETDIVGVGSDTIQFLLDQFSFDYNKSHKTGPRLYSWDALNPKTGLTDNISLKSGCTKIARPNGSSAGIATLAANTKTTDKKAFCADFARSSRGRSSSDPSRGPGGIQFVSLGKDAVTFATNATTNAPANLTTAQLNAIYSCSVTNWHQVGGKNAPIKAELPQTSSGTRAFFLTAIGLGTVRSWWLRHQHRRGERGRQRRPQGPERDLPLLDRQVHRREVPLGQVRQRGLHRQPGVPPEDRPEQVRL